MLASRTLPSPVGELLLIATRDALVGVYFPDHRPAPPDDVGAAPAAARHPVLDQAAAELTEYFAGRRRTFTVPLAARAGTPFQREVWDALERIPYASTWSYGELARAIRKPAAARAVGAANARNPLSIVVPCHRVIGMRGDTVGYAGGKGAKEWLLAHERGRAAGS